MDSKNLGMLGLTAEQADNFLADLSALNARYQQQYDEGKAAYEPPSILGDDGTLNFSWNLNSGLPSYRPSQELRDAYTNEYSELLRNYNVNPIIEGTDKLYYLDPGLPWVNPYGANARPNDVFGTRPGMYTRDSRTEGDFQWGDAFKGVVETLVNPLNYLPIPGVDGGGEMGSGVPWVDAIKNGLLDGSDDNYGVDSGNFNGFAPGEWENQPIDTGIIGDVADGIAGLMDWITGGGQGGLQVPIPGLPFPLPGGLTWEGLMDIVRSTGKTVQEVLEDITNGGDPATGQPGTGNPGAGGDPVGESEDEELSTGQPPWWGQGGGAADPVGESEQEDEGLVLGQPGWWEGGSLPPGYDPVGESEREDETPGVPATGGGSREAGGGGVSPAIALPALIPLLDEPSAPDIEMWDYIGVQDDSWGIDRPDYGEVQMADPYQFAPRVSQPVPVAYQREPRREYLDPVEQELLRRRGLLG